ncbi:MULTISPECIES: AraC family transcriptional regulator [Roseomonadaceae]|uniref:AraC family transcriptional regulator n=1 Tax=Falsiroseomonas oleicola TaxID=2801474 RepID=A0ABS6HE69_9PROT|nr:AraC family transcriptional regulator [Roseomonas oleicola]MBU8546999.1 AraC family transcriptional regulator [Roseomonas oleicola]
MIDSLVAAARSHAERHGRDGIARIAMPGLTVLREMQPTALQYAISNPLVAIVLQGDKRVTMGGSSFDFGAGESLLITADVPTVSQVTRASARMPYLSLVVDLDLAMIAALVSEMGPAPGQAGRKVSVDATEAEVAEAALRLMRLLERPSALPILAPSLMRELHFWLLSGRHGGAIRALGLPDGPARRIARAVAVIRAGYAGVLRVEALAEAAGMSLSAFHAHFRAATSLTPLQFQKQLRLIEARRRLVSEGDTIAHAAFAVGYESVPQFTREYGRLFGQPPGRDIRALRARPEEATSRHAPWRSAR